VNKIAEFIDIYLIARGYMTERLEVCRTAVNAVRAIKEAQSEVVWLDKLGYVSFHYRTFFCF
jgi:hypothetical protein